MDAAGPLPIQIDYPFAFDARGRTATTGDAAHIRDMIEQLLFTNPGERVNRPDFGSGVLQLVFAPGSEELASGLQFTVQASLQRWLGDVILVERVAALAEGERLFIEVVYTLRRTGDERREVFVRSDLA
jgi:uncharacterized protein